jgi:hypothetical protein
MFRAMFSPILRSDLTVYTSLVHRTDLLLTGDTVEMELRGVFIYLIFNFMKAMQNSARDK